MSYLWKILWHVSYLRRKLQEARARQSGTTGLRTAQAKEASYVLREYEDSAKLRSRRLDKHLIEPSDHIKIPLFKMMHFVGGWDWWRNGKCGERTVGQRMVPEQGSPCAPTVRLMLIYLWLM
jgi:hypothetical protein